MILHLVWIVVIVLRFGGLLAMVAGVAVFGVHFVGENARAAKLGDGTIPVSSWLGAGPRKGMRIFALGACMLLCASLLEWIVHH